VKSEISNWEGPIYRFLISDLRCAKGKRDSAQPQFEGSSDFKFPNVVFGTFPGNTTVDDPSAVPQHASLLPER